MFLKQILNNALDTAFLAVCQPPVIYLRYSTEILLRKKKEYRLLTRNFVYLIAIYSRYRINSEIRASIYIFNKKIIVDINGTK
jgi:dsDNA-specific endonuclease/ATPase MutS2